MNCTQWIILFIVISSIIFIIYPKVKVRYEINDIFYCAINNKIYMKNPILHKKRWQKRGVERNKREMLKGWDKLPVNTTFRCTTHSVFKRHIERQEKMGKLKILKCKQCILHTNLTVLEKSLGKTSDFSGKVNIYKIKFRT